MIGEKESGKIPIISRVIETNLESIIERDKLVSEK
jgi:hypothetical protein